jgi:hypothetical protein
MTATLNLTDTQLVLLSAASQRDDGLLVQPARLKGGAATAVVEKLLLTAYVEEIAVGRDDPHWRQDGNGWFVGLKITQAGLRAIGIGQEEDTAEAADSDDGARALSEADESASSSALLQRAIQVGSKQAHVLSLLQRHGGATLDDLIAATGWLPHSTRAALTGLRQRGYQIARSKGDDGRSVYHILRDEDERGTVLPTPAEA